MKTKAWDHRYWFQEVCFGSESNGFCSNHCLIATNLHVANDSQSLRSSVLIWRGPLRIWNQRFPQQPFSHCKTSHCFRWQPEPRNIGAGLQWSTSNMKPTVSAATVFLCWNVWMLCMTAKAYDSRYWFEKFSFDSETNVSATSILLWWIVSMLSMTAAT